MLREVCLPWKRMPCANTYRYALAHLDSQQVNADLAAWFVRQAKEKRSAEGRETEAAQPSRIWRTMAKRQRTGKQMYGGENPQQHLLHVMKCKQALS